MERLEAAEGLALGWDEGGGRLSWEHADWLGPVGFQWRGEARSVPESVRGFEGEDDLGRYRGLVLDWKDLRDAPRTSVRAYRERPLLVFRTEATEPLAGIASGRLDDPSSAWPHLLPAGRRPGGLPEDATAFGYGYAEFGLPTFSDPDCAGFTLIPWRPAVVLPLFLRTDRRSLMLCPLDGFHEQVIAVPRDAEQRERGVRCGWHGDLERVTAGFATELAVLGGSGVRDCLDTLGAQLLARHGTVRPSRYADASVARLSYWTDNGAAYWYRSEGGRNVEDTLAAVVEDLHEREIPVHAVELDSWFYPHEKTRAFDDPETVVPPTGLVAWEPRADVLPDGIVPLRQRLGNPPLVLHLRHFSSTSPYFDAVPAWRDGDRAHPQDPAFYESLFDHAEAWGAIQVEHDWLVECFLGVRELRARPGRARAWQQAIDRAAARRGLSLLWCMATPADFLASVELRQLAAIRTAGDYRYLIPSEQGWCWYLYGNALARALGLWPFKDVFISSRVGEGVDGDANAELEALLSALSAGPVGLGDRLGRADASVVMRTCRRDGVLVKPDAPLAALERCFRAHAHQSGEPLVAETYSDHEGGRTGYLLAVNAGADGASQRLGLDLSELGDAAPAGPVVAFDWRAGTAARLDSQGRLELALAPGEWTLQLLAPLLPAGLAIQGDPALYASAGDRRIRSLRGLADGAALEVVGAPGESPMLRGWSEGPLEATLHPEAGTRQQRSVAVAADGIFELCVPIGARGRTRVRLSASGADAPGAAPAPAPAPR